ncbi:MAG: hypothetical protein BGO67_02850 [Alphaproteobacteria bacterium 41-28]|nr:MAG: hypothetical protein BGO67_02850 [Alphaproteobacteria bacterium 41-28]
MLLIFLISFMKKNVPFIISFFSSFLIVALILSTQVHGMDKEDAGKKNIVIILRPMDSEQIRVTRIPFAIKSDHSELDGVPVSIHFINEDCFPKALPLHLKSLRTLLQTDSPLIKGVSFHDLLDYWFSRREVSQKDIGQQKKRSLKRTTVLFPLPPPDVYTLFHNYKIFGMTRQRFIETQTNPPFYSIFYGGKPLNVFILPVVHTLPLEALHPRILKWIHSIAETEGSKLIMEIRDDSSEEEGEDNPTTIEDSRKKLNIGQCIDRDIAIATSLIRGRYVTDENDRDQLALWKSKLDEMKIYLNEVFTQGWTNLLNLDSKEMLHLILKEQGKNIEYINEIDPYYFYSNLNYVLDEYLEKGYIIDLDSQISRIFFEAQREIEELENERDIDEAAQEEAAFSLPNAPFCFESYKLLIEESLQRFKSLIEETEEDLEKRIPTLDDIDFQDPVVRYYFREREKDVDYGWMKEGQVGVDMRNQRWWERTINPLLEERIREVSSSNTPPILLMYGNGHNLGSNGIKQRIQRKTGFQVRRLSRK